MENAQLLAAGVRVLQTLRLSTGWEGSTGKLSAAGAEEAVAVVEASAGAQEVSRGHIRRSEQLSGRNIEQLVSSS